MTDSDQESLVFFVGVFCMEVRLAAASRLVWVASVRVIRLAGRRASAGVAGGDGGHILSVAAGSKSPSLVTRKGKRKEKKKHSELSSRDRLGVPEDERLCPRMWFSGIETPPGLRYLICLIEGGEPGTF